MRSKKAMSYIPSLQNKAGKSMLLFGTDRGDIHILIFHTPIKGLFEKPFKKSDTVWKIFFSVGVPDLVNIHSLLEIFLSSYIPLAEREINVSRSLEFHYCL